MSDNKLVSSGVSDLSQLPDMLAERVDLARLLYRNLFNVIFATDHESRIILVDGDCDGVFGYTAEEMHGQTLKKLIAERDLARMRDHLRERFVSGRVKEERPLTVYARRKDGQEVPVELLVNPQTVAHATVLFCAFREVGEVRAARQAQNQTHSLLSAVVENMPAMVTAKDAGGRYLMVNALFAEVHGLDRHAAIGRTATELLGDRGRALDEVDALLMRDGRSMLNQEECIPDADGRDRTWLTSRVPLRDEGSVKRLLTISLDVTERQWDKEKADALVNYDELTGLPNRTHFMARLQEALISAAASKLPVGVLCVDLGRLNDINDSFGYTVGDHALRRAAIKLQTSVRESDTVARLGDDHFAVIQTGMLGVKAMEAQAHRIVDALSVPMNWQGHEIRFDPRCGLAAYPDHGRDARALVQNADLAMGRAKAAGERVRPYLEGMTQEVNKRRELTAGLWRALEQDHFELHFQPQIDMRTGRTCGSEALLRWNDPDRGLISPGDFIPLAESSDLIIPIGRWVLEEACRRIKEWQSRGLPSVPVAVNLSARQFQQPDLVNMVEMALADTGIDPHWIELEVTESAAMKDAEAAAATLARLHDLGVGLAIDDFGTGYSSLAYLRRFPAHKIKLDRAFVRGVPGDPHNAAISAAVVGLCHTLGKKVVAEGVEGKAQLDFLRGLGCDQVQGFLYSKPLPNAQFERWLASPTPVH